MNTGLNARKLRLVLIATLMLSIAAAAGGFYVVQGMLRDYATTISTLNAKADATDRNLQTLGTLEGKLADENEAINKAENIVAESKEYAYQDKIIEDITAIARSSNVKVTTYSFSETSGATAASPAPAAGAATPAPTPAAPAASTANSKQVSVTIESPLKYDNVMEFIKRIEKNSLKMQISNVALSRDGENPGSVSSQTFTIRVYVR